MTVSKFKRGQNIRVITVANKPELSSWKNNSFCRRPLRAVGSSLWVTGCCCHKMAKGGKLEPWNWHVLAHLL